MSLSLSLTSFAQYVTHFAFKKFAIFTASLSRSINLVKIKDIFDEDLFNEDILMPKLEFFQTPGQNRTR